jgi:pyridoxamine 5'-phosphate oxidase
MTREQIIEFINNHIPSFLATVEDGEPRVRGMGHYRADDKGIVFHTGEGKDLTTQIRKCPKAEMCIFDPETNVQVRVRGDVEIFDDQSLKEEIVEARPFLKPVVEAVGYQAFVLFRLTNCVATVWTMADNMAPKTFVKL